MWRTVILRRRDGKFIIADTPGHEQYTRNLVPIASTGHCGSLFVDATKGILPQTRRHAFIASLLGIRNVLTAVVWSRPGRLPWGQLESSGIFWGWRDNSELNTHSAYTVSAPGETTSGVDRSEQDA